MKICIWCCNKEGETSFEKAAHTFPKSLGGEYICENVCDVCNAFFGNKDKNGYTPELVFKEFINLTKYITLQNKILIQRFKSEFFNVDIVKRKITFKHKINSQENQRLILRYFLRGLFKVFLEERERQLGDSTNARFNFIRNFSRYDLGNLIVFSLKQRVSNIYAFDGDNINIPEMFFISKYASNLFENYKVYEYGFYGKVVSLIIDENFNHKDFINYAKFHTEKGVFNSIKEITNLSDIDFFNEALT